MPMKSGRVRWIILTVLVLLTAALTVLYLNTREKIPADTVLVTQGGERRYIAAADLARQTVKGNVVNAKGEVRQIDARGMRLADLAEGAAFSEIFAVSDDEYSARITPEDADNAYLILRDDGTVRLIVFGDENAKRDVKNVVRITIEP